jgi:23S rRNA maturation mini-RNase III
VFQWLEKTSLSVVINESLWAFAVVEAIHLLALAVIGGAVLVVDLRMLGLVFQRQKVGDLARVAQPWFVWSLVAILVTGFILFLSLAASKYYVHTYFWVKMYFLAAAMIFSFTVRHRIIMGNDARANSMLAKVVALVSLFLWSGVGFAGKAIGYIS